MQSAVAAAAYGLACGTDAAEDAADPLIDTHVSIGRWPLRRLTGDEPSELVATLRRNRVYQAWASSFDGLFHKDVHGANLRLTETCRQIGNGMLIPVGTVNPTLPDWQEDLRRCCEELEMPAIRLHPNYHGYTLDDPRFARLLELAAARKLLVQLVAWMSDERRMLLCPRPQQVELAPLAGIVRPLRDLRLVVSNGYTRADDDSFRRLAPLQQVCFDFARLDDKSGISNLIEVASANRVVFGSCSPLSRFEAARSKLDQVALTGPQRRAVCNQTAHRLLSVASR